MTTYVGSPMVTRAQERSIEGANRGGTTWTDLELQVLRGAVVRDANDLEKIARQLGRTVYAVEMRLRQETGSSVIKSTRARKNPERERLVTSFDE